MADHTQEAERAAFLAWWKKRVPAGSDSDHAAVFAYEVWQASRRAVAADTGVDGLPPLPKCVAYGVVGLSGLDPHDGHRQLIGVSVGRPGSWCKDSVVELHTAEQVRQAQREAVAADRQARAPAPPSRGTGSQREIKPLVRCAASRDGDCSHSQCPQARDGEPHKSQRHCPLDTLEDDE